MTLTVDCITTSPEKLPKSKHSKLPWFSLVRVTQGFEHQPGPNMQGSIETSASNMHHMRQSTKYGGPSNTEQEQREYPSYNGFHESMNSKGRPDFRRNSEHPRATKASRLRHSWIRLWPRVCKVLFGDLRDSCQGRAPLKVFGEKLAGSSCPSARISGQPETCPRGFAFEIAVHCSHPFKATHSLSMHFPQNISRDLRTIACKPPQQSSR